MTSRLTGFLRLKADAIPKRGSERSFLRENLSNSCFDIHIGVAWIGVNKCE